MKYKRILLKLSGESLQGSQKYGLSPEVLQSYAEQIRAAAARSASSSAEATFSAASRAQRKASTA